MEERGREAARRRGSLTMGGRLMRKAHNTTQQVPVIAQLLDIKGLIRRELDIQEACYQADLCAPDAKCGYAGRTFCAPSWDDDQTRRCKQTSVLGTTMKYKADRLALLFFMASVACLLFCYGVVVGKYEIFPYRILALAKQGFRDLRGKNEDNLPWYYRRVKDRHPAPLPGNGEACEGLNLVVRMAAGELLSAEIIDMDGKKLHEWNIDWFEIWPDAEHVPHSWLPRSRPGTHVHGAVVMENGDLVFNFEHLGLVRLDRQGEVVWRLPYQTHHSVHRHDDGNLWVCGQKERTEPDPRFPHRVPPFTEHTLLEVTPEGKILQEWSVPELLRKNGRGGLLHLGSLENRFTPVEGDLLHLNDVEPFPSTLEEGFFKQGDVLVSLRNINTVFVFNRQSGEIKFICTGWFVRQHDPDFIDGNTFSVFDNNCIAPEEDGPQSRILIVSATDNTCEVFFEGTPQAPFYTDILGKHQWLPNGNLLITESCRGRAFEVNRRGEVVWEYVNYVDGGVVGLVEEVQRLPLDYAPLFGGGG